MRIAIIAVAYNRPDSLHRLLNSLQDAWYDEDVPLVISVDKSNTDSVERIADEFDWKHGRKKVSKHGENLGLKRHMLSLDQYFTEYDALIVLEDDITVSPSFYFYAKACVAKYSADDNVAGVSLYSFAINYQTFCPFTPQKSPYDIYLMNCAQSWGEIWMKDSWIQFRQWFDAHDEDFNLEYIPRSINRWPKSSWLKHHTRYCIEENKYFVYPYLSLSTNHGDPGVNFTEPDTMFQVELQNYVKKEYQLPSSQDSEVIKYDAYFERKALGTVIGLDDTQLCVDIQGTKPQCLYRHYLLSCKCLPYRVIRSFALHLRPMEMNVIQQCDGSTIFLYDTAEKAIPPIPSDTYQLYYYMYSKGFYNALFMLGIKGVFRRLVDLVSYKINKTFHTNLPCRLR